MLALSSMWHQLEGMYINWFLEVYNEFLLVPKIWTLWTSTSAWDQRDVFGGVEKLNRWFQYDRFAILVFHVLKIYHIIQRLLFINNIYLYIHTVHCKPTKCARLPLPTTPIHHSHPLSTDAFFVPCLGVSPLPVDLPWPYGGTRAWSKSIQQQVAFCWNPCWHNPRLPDQFHQWSKGIIQ